MAHKREDKRSRRRDDYVSRATKLFEEYQTIIVIEMDEVTSKQLQDLRRKLRETTEIFVSVNIKLREAIRNTSTKYPSLLNLIPFIKGNIALVFTREYPFDIIQTIKNTMRTIVPYDEMLAPYDIIVPIGPTQLEPTRTSYFASYNIGTKINKGRIEVICAAGPLVKKGDPFSPPTLHLFKNLNVAPIQFGMEIRTVYIEGLIFEDTAFHSLERLVKRAAFNIASISQAVGLYTLPCVPYSIRKGLINVLAAHRALNTSPTTFPQTQTTSETQN